MLRAQSTDPSPSLEKVFIKHLQIMTDSLTVVLAVLDAQGVKHDGDDMLEKEEVLDEIIFGILRTFKTELSTDGILDSLSSDLNQYSDQLQKESLGVYEHMNHASTTGQVQPSHKKATAEVSTVASGAVVAEQSVPIAESAFLPKKPFYEKKTEEEKLDIEGRGAYQNDDNHGDRILETFETELLAKISSKQAAGRSLPGVASSAVHEPAGCPTNDLQPNTLQLPSKTATLSRVGGTSLVVDARAANELRGQAQGDGASDGNCSPPATLIGDGAAQKKPSEKKLKVKMEQQAGSGRHVAESAHRENRQNVKHVASGDDCYLAVD
eukprot:TRINITY_DN38858_c0_g1_i1.p1 TRINITY_DN38858_c0_g1~~TRINITY_DN38858_c0_g1_i1.p1  ORF type:complete len:360 (+),score=66.48 TRINITY_DN38858_c0_g1_i1:109-1080(+)